MHFFHLQTTFTSPASVPRFVLVPVRARYPSAAHATATGNIRPRPHRVTVTSMSVTAADAAATAHAHTCASAATLDASAAKGSTAQFDPVAYGPFLLGTTGVS